MVAHRVPFCFHTFRSLSRVKLSCRSVHFSAISQTLPQPDDKTKKHIIFCNTQITKHGRNSNIKEAEAVFNHMPIKSTVSWTAMLTAYSQNGQLKEARLTFDKMPHRNIASWNAMITAYMRNKGEVNELYELFFQMPERNAVSYAAMMTGFAKLGRLNEAERLYNETPVEWRDPVCSNVMINGYLKIGKLEDAVKVFKNMVVKDVVSWSSMVDGYCRSERVSEARKLFDMIREKNVVTWSAMINGYMKMGCFEEGIELFMKMRREGIVRVENTILTIMFEACGRFERFKEGCQVHGLNVHLGFDFDVFLGNAVITMYSRFGCIDVAKRVFDTMKNKDVISWNSLIAGFVQAEKLEEAYGLFETFSKKDVVSWTTMVTGFANKGLTGKCLELFNMMPEKDDVAWTALISGFVNNGGHEEAMRWFIQMLGNAVRPNPLTLSSALSASAAIASLNQGLQIHALACKMDMEFDLSIQNSLVSMYSKCGNVSDAYRIFKSISAPNIVSFNSMIVGFAQNGFGKEAINLFRKAQNIGQVPNEITFLGVLSACTYVGLVEEGWNYFNTMRSLYNIEPGIDHYACMVDLLGRAGLLDDAINLINSMPMEPHAGVWGALLAASKTHLRLDLAKLAAHHISELEPNNAAPYVVLSDIYTFAGKKKDEEQVRMAKKMNGIKKTPGCSWITVKDKLNLFLSGDRSHVNFGEIKSTLLVVVDEMKQMNYTDENWLPSKPNKTSTGDLFR